ncbi:MAG: helix-turn-helix transcriptional regulator [Clostridiales bacterium]|nr:helix-turn-helix transcriptional regulator [Clostridiales bacterium]
MDFQQQLGLRLRDCRKAKGYKMEEFADLSGFDPGYLGRIERGEINITLKTLGRLVEALEISYGELFDFEKTFLPPKDPLVEKTLSNLYYLTLEEKENIYQTTLLFRGKKGE